ncbi:cell wall-binding repeat-containing protein [Herbiconiux daphne]|uniref:Cell wall-binding repeat-containing protein n=1 Tax=Herbiconiux daphne TaxID=2970914 RepID=A0ABT2H1S7_9MICO|nr:cell wall-binding repeat-containing protein [Herbiconiux daphne]MCS5733869.1 cell wall-binding repeat-containing protein [Herbiconiux daphne]
MSLVRRRITIIATVAAVVGLVLSPTLSASAADDVPNADDPTRGVAHSGVAPGPSSERTPPDASARALVTPPPNDALANATDIPTLPFSTTSAPYDGATLQPGEPTPCRTTDPDVTEYLTDAVSSIWFRYTSPVRQTLTFDGGVNNQYSIVNAYRLAPIADLQRISCVETDYRDLNFVQAEPGVTYVFQVGDAGYEPLTPGDVATFRLSGSAPVDGVTPESAQTIASLPATVQGSNMKVDFNWYEPYIGCDSIDHTAMGTIWWKFTATTTGPIVADLRESFTPVSFVVWDSNGSTPQNSLACAPENAGNSEALATFTAQAGQTYFIQVGSFGFDAGDFQLTLSSAAPPPTVDRVGGADRFEVALNISKAAYPATADIVFLATGGNYPDALSAGPAAAHLGGPLLLTAPGTLLPDVLAEIRRLEPDQIVVVGGPDSISPAVFDEVQAVSPNTVRIGGKDRYEASRNLAKFAFRASGAETSYVATGTNFPDALSAGPAAAVADGPVILVNGSAATVDDATKLALADLGVDDVVIAGGPNSVSVGIENALKGSLSVVRDGGTDRFDASVNINLRAFPAATRAFFATGLTFPDALSGSAWAGVTASPLYVTRTTCVPNGVLTAIAAQGVDHVTVLGGTSSLTPAVEALTPCGT